MNGFDYFFLLESSESPHSPKYRFYGNNIKIMIDEAIKWEEGDMKEGLIFTIANHIQLLPFTI